MGDAVKRTVRLGSMAYVDPSGRVRRADCGAEIDVHPDHVGKFDELNVLAASESSPEAPEVAREPEPQDIEPKRRPGRPRKAEPEE